MADGALLDRLWEFTHSRHLIGAELFCYVTFDCGPPLGKRGQWAEGATDYIHSILASIAVCTRQAHSLLGRSSTLVISLLYGSTVAFGVSMSSAIPHEELPILEALINIRNRLTALKKDSGEFIRPQDVTDIYKAVIKQGEWPASIRHLLRCGAIDEPDLVTQ